MPRLFTIAYFSFFIFLCSCNRNTIELLDIRPNAEETENIEGLEYVTCSTESYDLHVAFIEDAIEHLVFHLIVENYSKDSLELTHKDFELKFIDLNGEGFRVRSIDVNDRKEFLVAEKEGLGREKKTRTIGNVILAGLEAVAIAISPGGSVAGAIVYAAESSVYIAEDRNAFNIAQLSIDDHINYLEDWVLYKDVIGPESDSEFDILFERFLRNSDLIISADINGQYCEVEFWQRVQSSRNR